MVAEVFVGARTGVNGGRWWLKCLLVLGQESMEEGGG